MIMDMPKFFNVPHLGFEVICETASYFVDFKIYKTSLRGKSASVTLTPDPLLPTNIAYDKPDIEGSVAYDGKSQWTIGEHAKYIITDVRQFDDLSEMLKICHEYAKNYFLRCDEKNRRVYLGISHPDLEDDAGVPDTVKT